MCYLHLAWEGQESEISSAGLFWLGVSHAAAVELLDRAAISSKGLTRAGGSSSKLSDMALGRRLQFLAAWTFSVGQLRTGQVASFRASDLGEQDTGYPGWKARSFIT